MFIPVTKKDLIATGKRLNTEQLINEIDRLLRLAEADIAVLEKRGYDRERLDELRELRSRLADTSSARRTLVGRKSGAVRLEEETIAEGKVILRSGVSLLLSAVSRFASTQVPEQEELSEQVSALKAQVKALEGKIGTNSAVVRTRLGALKDLLSRAEFAPAASEAAARAEFMTELDDVIARLTCAAEEKKNLKDSSKDKTAELDELDGRAYHNMSLLSRVGKTAFREANDPQHASLYRLALRRATRADSTPAAATETNEAPARTDTPRENP